MNLGFETYNSIGGAYRARSRIENEKIEGRKG